MNIIRTKSEIKAQINTINENIGDGDIMLDPERQAILDRLSLAININEEIREEVGSQYLSGINKAEDWLYGQTQQLEIL